MSPCKGTLIYFNEISKADSAIFEKIIDLVEAGIIIKNIVKVSYR